MTKVLIATAKPFAKVAIDKIQQVFDTAGYKTQLLEKYADQADFVEAVKDADALIIRSDEATKEIFDAAKNLKIIVRAGAGYDNIDLQAATQNNVVAMNTPGQNSNAVAELAFGMMLYQARKHFNGSTGTELRGKNIGIHAYGNVGKYVAAIAKGFGMEVYAFNPSLSRKTMEENGINVMNTAEELYSNCQYISLHIPAREKNKAAINYELLSKLPAGGTLVNTARKEIICENSLLRIFEERKDFQYLSDIAPDCSEKIAEKYQGRYYFTPKKMGAQTAEANINAGIAAARQIVSFLENGDKTCQVN